MCRVAATAVILAPSPVPRDEARTMSGAGTDAQPITSIPSSHERHLPVRTGGSALHDDGLSPPPPSVAAPTAQEPEGEDPEKQMAGKVDLVESATQLQAPRLRIYFDEFAAQIRLHRQQDRYARVLRLRQESLQKSIALTQRLRRVGRVIQDGLVDLSGHNDKAGFTRVYHCINELSTTCHARWKDEIQAHDIPTEPSIVLPSIAEEQKPFLCTLSRNSRRDLSRLLESIRTEPKFLVGRIKGLSQVQLDGICQNPGEEAQASVLPQFPQNRNSRSQSRRNATFVNSLEDFAISLERKEPLRFMLCNVFGTDQDSDGPEHWLRLDTWSSVCAELFLDEERYTGNYSAKYHKLIGRILYMFASFHPWRAAQRIERYLMDVLQRGAVLLEAVDRTPASSFRGLTSDPLDTPEAEAFFEDAVQDLVAILSQHDGGIPPAALQFASVVIGKLPTEQSQSDFRGHVLGQWFMLDFLASAISYPEVSTGGELQLCD